MKKLLVLLIVAMFATVAQATLQDETFTLTTIEGDILEWGPSPPFLLSEHNWPDGDDKINMVLDLGSVLPVDGIRYQNQSAPTLYTAWDVSIWVASDESASGFDPTQAASFTQKVTAPGARFMPDEWTGSTWRDVDIADYSRQYFLIEVLSNAWGPIGAPEPTQTNAIILNDMDVVLVPEPVTIVMLGLGGLAALRRRR